MKSTSKLNSGSTHSRSARRHSTLRIPKSAGGGNRDDRRQQDLRQETEAAIHVLDNGVNRTPMQLQRHGSIHGASGHQGRGSGDMSSSIFQSSFLLSSDGRSGSKFQGDTSMLSYMGSDSRRESTVTAMEMSTQSISLIPDGNSSSRDGGNNRPQRDRGSLGLAGDLSKLMSRQLLLDQCVAEHRSPMTEVERRAWAKEKTTITLTETPTIILYTHQDEFVSNEDGEAVRYTTERNQQYTRLEEAGRVGEGTRYLAKGVMTFAAPKKSIHSEVQPPEKTESGALQVTPWMLRDEFAPLLDDNDDYDEAVAGADEDEEDHDLEPQLDDEMDAGNSVSDDQSSREQVGTGVKATQKWIFADSLMSNLRIMERAVVQNYMEEVQLAYRGIAMDAACSRRPLTLATTAAAAVSADTKAPSHERHNSGSDDDNDASSSAGKSEGDGSAAAGAAQPMPTTIAQRNGQTDLPAVAMTDDIQLLWCFHSFLTAGRSVTCMTWNRKEPDILAVGYSVRRHSSSDALEDDIAAAVVAHNVPVGKRGDGSAGAKADGGAGTAEGAFAHGLVCCWSLKNPLAPELVLHLHADAGVSALAFSYEHPSLLAVGNTDGGLVVYDVQKDLAAPSITPAVATGLHTGAVWDLRWVARGKERGEFLMSISADGRVVQWAVGKSIEKVAPDLMHLKRQPGAQVESAFVEGVAAVDEAAGRRRIPKEEAVLSRQSGGMCFDVCPTDSAIYVVGTEDGSVYQCNKSQTETYDLDYVPHAELVYRVRWSPYSADYFLTCSADWTTRLYKLGQAKPVLRFDSPNQDAVQDVAWSSTNSRAFATATAQGNVELWSVMDTIYPHSSIQFEDHRRLSSVLFADQETPVVVVGDEEGDVTVFLLSGSNFTRQDLTDDEQERWLADTIQKQSV